jgi:hypothetical protein
MFDVRMVAAILTSCKQPSAGGGGSGFAVGEAVAVGAGFDDVAAEGKPVHDRAQPGVGKGFGPTM